MESYTSTVWNMKRRGQTGLVGAVWFQKCFNQFSKLIPTSLGTYLQFCSKQTGPVYPWRFMFQAEVGKKLYHEMPPDFKCTYESEGADPAYQAT